VVRGLARFREHFQGHTHQFVLIGGAACDLAMSDAGLIFRSTKDLDIVLFLEAMTPEFGRVFWEFIRMGGYAAKEKEDGGKQYYRFSKPAEPHFPAMLEIFSKVAEGLVLPPESVLTPIFPGEDVSNLSAILLDEAYYGFLHQGKKEVDGLPIVGAEHLMALKARAWLDLSARRARGEAVDRENVLKHKRDVFRLFQIADPVFSAEIPGAVQADMKIFLESMIAEGIDLKSIGINELDIGSVLDGMRRMFRIA
jgi:hypothetical protein